MLVGCTHTVSAFHSRQDICPVTGPRNAEAVYGTFLPEGGEYVQRREMLLGMLELFDYCHSFRDLLRLWEMG